MNEEQKQRFAAALQRVAGDQDMLKMLANIAVEDAPSLMQNLDTSIRQNDLAEAAKTAHQLKGLLSAFETGEPVSGLQPLIDAARVENHAESVSVHASLQPQLRNLIDEIAAVACG